MMNSGIRNAIILEPAMLLLVAGLLWFTSCDDLRPAGAEPMVKRGTASWYSIASVIREGTCTDAKTQQCLQANGQPLDDHAYTAAFRSYDFGKRYRVTNVQTGKSIIVIHTDYGPAKRLKDRIIDLSRAAYASIDDLHHGLCQVTVEQLHD